MKTLKSILKESITPSGLDKHLNAFRQAAKSGMNGPIGEYTDVLELTLDWMSNRVQANDKDFDQFMQKLKDSGFEPGEPESEPQSIKKQPKRKVVANLPDTEEEPQKTQSEKEPEKEKKPEEPKKEPSIPSLSSLAGQEKGSPSSDTNKEEPGEEPNKTLKDLPKFSKKKDDDDFASSSMPSISSLANKNKKSSGQKSPLHISAPIGTDPANVDTQDWEVGKKVKVGFMQSPFKIVGGDKDKGWVLVDKNGRDYIFYPSRHPKFGRGLYRVK